MRNILKVLSYNIWFSEEHRIERTISLIETIRNNNPDIICLQEVVTPVFNYLIKNLVDYPFYYPINYEYKYNCIILSKYFITKFDKHIYENSNMGRSLIAILLNIETIDEQNDDIIKKFPLLIATSHFESLFKLDNEIKLNQYKTAKKFLEELSDTYQCPVIFCADTNLLSNEESYYLTKDICWKDSWIERGSDKNNKFTYDSIQNDNLKNRNIGVIRSRIDRIVYNKSTKLKLLDFKLVKGNESLIEPSDHYGVMSEFKFSS